MAVIKPEHRQTVRKAGNFFKHADTDPTAELEFNTAANGFLLLQCLHAPRQLIEKMSATETVFWVRFGLENPEIVDQDAYDRMVDRSVQAEARARWKASGGTSALGQKQKTGRGSQNVRH